MLADNGSARYLSGAPDDRFDNDDLRTLGTISGTDPVAVDTSPMQVAPNSGQVR